MLAPINARLVSTPYRLFYRLHEQAKVIVFACPLLSPAIPPGPSRIQAMPMTLWV
jgi:hypothetical protein